MTNRGDRSRRPFRRVLSGTHGYIEGSPDNKALYLADTWVGNANYTGGDAGNSLSVTVLYTVVDL